MIHACQSLESWLVLKFNFFSEPKVTYFQNISFLDENIGWFDVSVDQAFVMDVLQTVQKLLE